MSIPTESFPLVVIHCNPCGHETEHDRVAFHSEEVYARDYSGHSGLYEDHENVSTRTTLSVLRCRGCRTIAVRSVERFSETPENPEILFFPPRSSRKPPKWLEEVDSPEISGLFQEVYTALHAGSRRLAMMGCRAILDRTIHHSIGDIGGFERSLKEMVKTDLLSSPHSTIIHAAFDAGSASAHRGHNPDIHTMDSVVSIVENLVQQIFILGDEAEAIKSRTPKRPSKDPKQPGTSDRADN